MPAKNVSRLSLFARNKAFGKRSPKNKMNSADDKRFKQQSENIYPCLWYRSFFYDEAPTMGTMFLQPINQK